MTNNYQDYFIKDGQHIGQYEEMYQKCRDPWNIDSLGFRLDMQAALLLLGHRLRKCNHVLDAACGAGLFTEFLARKVWQVNEEASITGIDISETAISLAKKRMPGSRFKFEVADLNYPLNFWAEGSFDLIVMGQSLWCILENLPRVMDDFHRLLSANGLLLITQHFPQPEQQSYGKEIVSCPEDLVKFITQAHLEILDTLETNRLTNHHWAVVIRKA